MGKFYKLKSLKYILNHQRNVDVPDVMVEYIERLKKRKIIFSDNYGIDDSEYYNWEWDKNWFKELTLENIYKRGQKYFHKIKEGHPNCVPGNEVIEDELNKLANNTFVRLKPLHKLNNTNIILDYENNSLNTFYSKINVEDLEYLTTWRHLSEYESGGKCLITYGRSGEKIKINKVYFYFDIVEETEKEKYERLVDSMVNPCSEIHLPKEESILNMELSKEDEHLIRVHLEDWKNVSYEQIKEELEHERGKDRMEMKEDLGCKKEKKGMKMKERGMALMTSNRNAFQNAARLEVGNAAITQVTKLVKDKLPKSIKKYADSPVIEVVMANAVGVAIQEFMPGNEKANLLADSMLDAAALKLIKEFDFPKMVDDLLKSVNLDSIIDKDK